MRLRLLIVAMLAAVGLGACTTDGTPTEDLTGPDTVGIEESPGTRPVGAPRCALAPVALVKSTLGVEVVAPQESTNGSVVTCTYLSGSVSGTAVIVRFITDQDAPSFALERRGVEESGNPTTTVNGLGDEAYNSSVEFGDTVTNTLVARKGTVAIQVIAVASVDAAKALVEKLFTAIV